VSIQELGESRAVVTVSAEVEWRPGRVDVGGQELELEKKDGDWRVKRVLRRFAS